MCDSEKGETFCERSKKEQSARKISRCARNDSVEGCSYPTYPAKAVPGKHSFRIVIGSEACLNAIYLFISIAHHAFLIIIYFSNLEYFLWIYLRRHAGNNRCKCISLYDLINSRLCKFRNSINSYVNAKQK